MAKKKVSNAKLAGQTVSVLVIMVILTGLIFFALQLQNYRLSVSAEGIKWIPRQNVATIARLSIDNSASEKLILQADVPRGCDGVQFRVARNQNLLWIGSVYQTDRGYKILGKLKGGKMYYIQARSFRKGVLNRNVCGPWTSPRAVMVRK